MKPSESPTDIHSSRRLVADVGGTNIRLALSHVSDVSHTSPSGSLSPGNGTDVHEVVKLACADFDSLSAALKHYLSGLDNHYTISEACLAVAGPVNTDHIRMTNLPWEFSQQALKAELGLSALKIINDFAAVAHSIPVLQKTDYCQLGGGHAEDNAPILAIGPGTGLGMAMLIPGEAGYLAFPAEGGHASISAQTAQERDIVAHHIEQGNTEASLTPCREFFLSGRGLAAIFTAIGGSPKLEPSDISQRAVAGDDALCVQALEIFCGWLGSTCGDQAVSSGALGGVYIAGGMVKQFLPFLQASSFRSRFENKGAMQGYLSSIPCFAIQRDHVALLGCAAAAVKS